MKVLMFAWEFPPHLSGGLGTACFGLTQSLTRQKVDYMSVKTDSDVRKSRYTAIMILPPVTPKGKMWKLPRPSGQ